MLMRDTNAQEIYHQLPVLTKLRMHGKSQKHIQINPEFLLENTTLKHWFDFSTSKYGLDE